MTLGTATLIAAAMGHPLTKPLLVVVFAVASLLWLRRTLVEFGFESLRGRFTFILSLAFAVQGVGILFLRIGEAVALSVVGESIFILARLLFLLANSYYTLHWLRIGVAVWRLAVALSLTLLILSAELLLPGFLENLTSSPINLVFVAADHILLLTSFYNLLLLWGGDVARRWIAGAAVTLMLVLGDSFYVAGLPAPVTLVAWGLTGVSIGLTGTIRGG